MNANRLALLLSVFLLLPSYVVETWGMEAVIDLTRNNGDISGTLGISTSKFESGWYQFIERKYLN
jgi:hypothetical protein